MQHRTYAPTCAAAHITGSVILLVRRQRMWIKTQQQQKQAAQTRHENGFWAGSETKAYLHQGWPGHQYWCIVIH
jgi:hypothetical protein